jgi:CRP-like cAMP-binding protein
MLRQQILAALEKVEKALIDADNGRDEVLRLIEGEKQETYTGAKDSYHAMALAMGDSVLYRDPTEDILQGDLSGGDQANSVFYVKGCLGPKTPIVHPEHQRLLVWILVGMIFILYEVFLTPYRLCFDAPADGPMFVWETIINVYFLCDVCLNFFVSYLTPEGQVIRVHSEVIKNYLFGWFLVDIAASIPVDWIEYAMSEDGAEKQPTGAKMFRMLRILRFLRMARVLRIAKLRMILDRIEEEIEGSQLGMLAIQIVKILLFLFFIAHQGACFWFAVGEWSETRYGSSWISSKVPEYQWDAAFSRSTYYLWSFHFAMATMTTVGYGDISPTNTAELAYTLMLLWVSMITFSGCMGVLMNMMTGSYEAGQERRTRMIELATYMNWRVLPRRLRGAMRKYLNFVWDNTEKVGETEAGLMEKLSPTLRSKLCVHIFGGVLLRCPFLVWMSDDREALKKLCLRMMSVFFEANDMLFAWGEKQTMVYVLVNGWVTIMPGSIFKDDEEDEMRRAQDGGQPAVMRRQMTSTFDLTVAKLDKKVDSKEHNRVHERVRRSLISNNKSPALIPKQEGEQAYIQAPAFFGESLLFIDEPGSAGYSARCLTRAEFTTFTREDVETVLRELPYMRSRYEEYREKLVSGWERTYVEPMNGAAKSRGSRSSGVKLSFEENGTVVDKEMKPVAPSSHPEPLDTHEVLKEPSEGSPAIVVVDVDDSEDLKLAGNSSTQLSEGARGRGKLGRDRPASAKRKMSPKAGGQKTQSGFPQSPNDVIHPYAVREGAVEERDHSPPPNTPTAARRYYVSSRASPPRAVGNGRPASSMRGSGDAWGSMEGPNIASI